MLSTIAISVTTTYLRTHGHAASTVSTGLTHGFSVAFWFGAVFCGARLPHRVLRHGPHPCHGGNASGPGIEVRPTEFEPVSPSEYEAR